MSAPFSGTARPNKGGVIEGRSEILIGCIPDRIAYDVRLPCLKCAHASLSVKVRSYLPLATSTPLLTGKYFSPIGIKDHRTSVEFRSRLAVKLSKKFRVRSLAASCWPRWKGAATYLSYLPPFLRSSISPTSLAVAWLLSPLSKCCTLCVVRHW